MRAFFCEVCGQRLYFENSECLSCLTKQAFVPIRLKLHPLRNTPRCDNAELAACNWVAGPAGLCMSCELTTERPSDDDPEAIAEYALAEAAKRRLVYSLLWLGLPLGDDLKFRLLCSRGEPVMTGHADGVITLDLAESDDATRVRRREQLHEPYRTLLGHFRHEIGHYYQPIIVTDWDACRALFGDERESYQAALNRHYENGPPADWAAAHVSAYATMHAWEDWAETFAHYLHITDTIETAEAFGLSALPDDDSIGALMDTWLPLTYGLNQVNRSMGRPDLYPFTLREPVVEKLGFVHECVRAMAPHQDQQR